MFDEISGRDPGIVAAHARTGDAFMSELARLMPDLRGRALRLTRDGAHADDLVQDSIERAIRFRAQYVPGTNLRSWAMTIVFSVFVTGYRRRRRERDAMRWLASDPCAWTREETTTPDAGLSEPSPPVVRALDALPGPFREVLSLVDVQEMSYRDAAEVLGVPVGTVMSRLHRARRQLAQRLSAPPLPIAA